MASLLVRSSPDRAVWVRALAGDIVLCSWGDTLLSECLSPPKCINGYLRIKANICTFTASQDCLSIPIRVYPVIPVNHLISFTGLDLTARFSRKLLNGAKRNCVIKQKICQSNFISNVYKKSLRWLKTIFST